MSEVSCQIFEFFERHAGPHGYALEDLVAGCGAPLGVLQDREATVPWATCVALSERLAVLIGGLDAARVAGRAIPDLGFSAPTRALGRAVLHPAQLYVAWCRWLGPGLFRTLRFDAERTGSSRVSLRIECPDPVSPAWFAIAQGAFERLPSLMGVEDAHVSFRREGAVGVYDVTVPASRSLISLTRRRLEAFAGTDRMIAELGSLTDDVRGAYQAVRESEAQLQQVLGALPDAVAVRVSGRTVFENPAWRMAFGETPPDGSLPPGLAAAAGHLDGDRTDDWILRPPGPGEPRTFTSPPPTPVRWGAAAATLIVLRDVTASEHAAERRGLADRLRSLGTVAAGVGHEINNPLAYALGELEVLEGRAIEGSVTPGELREGLATVREALLRVRDISRDLLAFGRPPKGFEPTDARAAVDAALRLAGAQLKHSVQLRVALPDAPMVVSGRPGELAQVFLNLAINARDAMAALPLNRRRLMVRGRTAGEWHVFTFADRGEGVPEPQRARLFEPYFTTKGDGGTGLGLAVCAKITREHGGEIALLDGDGDGAVFEVRLPVLDAPLPAAVAAPAPPPVRRRLRVLVVDDQVRFATLLPRLLPRHAVVFEQTGESALSRLAAGEHFDVLLCDVMMPGMDGPTLHQRIRGVDRALAMRTLFVTGGAFDGGARTYLQESGQPVLAKPYERRALVRAIESVVAAADAVPAR